MVEVLDVEGISVEDTTEEVMAIMGEVEGGLKDKDTDKDKDDHHIIVHNPSMYLLGLYGFQLPPFRLS